ncbi:hypothetical protein CRENBAI_006565 [Crenichthys baileyi]|uniref:Uncharacterized protein n=1 Tax=Crenichthys baileyi TaxID=28760 RepID=A0AAV9R7G0_9TELE
MREHLVIMSPKQMHLVSDQNSQSASFPVGGTAHVLGMSPHYLQHRRSKPRSFLHRQSVQGRDLSPTIQTREHVFILPSPAHPNTQEPSGRRGGPSIAACLCQERLCNVQPSRAAQAHFVADVRVRALWPTTTSEAACLWQVYNLINDVGFICSDIFGVDAGRCIAFIV